MKIDVFPFLWGVVKFLMAYMKTLYFFLHLVPFGENMFNLEMCPPLRDSNLARYQGAWKWLEQAQIDVPSFSWGRVSRVEIILNKKNLNKSDKKTSYNLKRIIS